MKTNISQTLSAKDRLNLFVALTNEEFDALWGHVPMTQERFERILLACARLDDLSLFVDFRSDYPEYMARLKEKVFVTKESNAFFLDKPLRTR